jgi:hypothetical protein
MIRRTWWIRETRMIRGTRMIRRTWWIRGTKVIRSK